MKVHTSRSLYDKWDEIHSIEKEWIKKLKEKRKYTTIPEEQDSIEFQLNESYVKTNMLRDFLADVGLMVYVEENKS
jgi:ribosomal protein S4